MEIVCENCARPDHTLVAVHRVYEVPPDGDATGSRTVLTDIEEWCTSCVSQYPNDPADPRR